jgi:hypothetical protein
MIRKKNSSVIINSRLADIIIATSNAYLRQGADTIITSGNDATHSAASLHYKDMALDFRTRHVTTAVLAVIVAEIKTKLGNNYDVIIESDHLHIEYDPKVVVPPPVVPPPPPVVIPPPPIVIPPPPPPVVPPPVVIPPVVLPSNYEVRNGTELQATLLKVNPGDVVTLRGAGPYASAIEQRGDPGNKFGHTMSGAPNAWLTFQAAAGEVPTFTADWAAYSVVWTRWLGPITFNGGHNFGLERATWISGARKCTDVQFNGLRFNGTQPRFGFMELHGDRVTVENIVIRATAGGDTLDHGIYFHAGSDLILRNFDIAGCAGYGVHCFDETKSEDAGFGENRDYRRVLIENGKVTNTRLHAGVIASVGTGATIDGLEIRYCVLVNNGGGQIEVSTYGGQAPSNVNMHHNTLVGKDGLLLSGQVAIRAGRFTDNIAKVTGQMVAIDWENTQDIVNANNFLGDPGFVNEAAGDYHLVAGSPAAGKGAF